VLTLGDTYEHTANVNFQKKNKKEGHRATQNGNLATIMGSEASLSGLHHSIVVKSKTHMITVNFQRMCVRAKTQSRSICILLDPCVLRIISFTLFPSHWTSI